MHKDGVDMPDDFELVATKGSDFDYVNVLSDVIKKGIVNNQREYLKKHGKVRETETKFYASGVGFTCWRKKYYDIFCPKTVYSEMDLRGLLGGYIHDSIIELAPLYNKNFSVKIGGVGYVISGRIDLIGEHLIEIKTVENIAFVGGSPYKPNIMQVNVYMVGTDFDESIIAYVDRTTLKTREFLVKRNEDIVIEIMDKHDKFKFMLDCRELPKRKRSYKCESCAHGTDCANDINLGLKLDTE